MPRDKRIEILSQSEIEEYSSPPVFSEADREYFFHMTDEEKAFIRPRDTPTKVVFYALLLGYFKERPIVLDINPLDVADDIRYISEMLFPGRTLRITALSPAQKSRIYKDIFAATGVKSFDSEINIVRKAAKEAARVDISRRAIFRAVIDSIQDNNCILPKYYRLQKIVSEASNNEMKRLQSSLNKAVKTSTVDRIQRLISEPDSPAFVSRLKKPIKSFEEKDFDVELAAFKFITPIYNEINDAILRLKTSKANLEYFASMVDYYTVSKLKAMTFDKVTIYLVCYLASRYRLIVDRFVDAFVYWVRKIDSDATAYSKQEALNRVKEIREMFSAAADILDLHIDKSMPDPRSYSDHKKRVFNLLSEDQIASVSEYMRSLSGDNRVYYWEYISKSGKKKIEVLLRKLLLSLVFVDTTGKEALLEQIQTLKKELSEEGGCQSIDLRLIFKKDRPYMLDEDDTIISTRAEFGLFKLVKDKLDKCAWYVENGERHRPLEEDLISQHDWMSFGQQIREASGLESMQHVIDDRVDERLEQLTQSLKEVADLIKNKETESVKLSDKKGEYAWTVKRLGNRNESNDKFFRVLPQIRVTEVIRFAFNKTDFAKAMTGIGGKGDASADFGKMAAVLIANATRMGLHKMAENCSYSYDELRTFQAKYFRMETLTDAVDCISNEAYHLSIFEQYNLRENVLHGSIDGQKFSSRKTTLRTRFSSKYLGQDKGLANVTMVVNHFPIRSRLAELNIHESNFVYDLLYNNNSIVQPEVLSSDTHGANRFNFAFLELSGLAFAPRYKTLGKVISSLFKVVPKGDSWELQLKSEIKRDKIIEGWDYAQRIFMSLRQREISQATLVRKLSRSSPADKSLVALTEYDRLIKCLYILELMKDVDLRRYLQHILNRGEAYHQLQRAIEGANGPDGFIGESDRQMDESMACAHLLSSCIIFFNAYLLSLLLDRFKNEDNQPKIEHLRHISPVAWSYINMSGHFAFDEDGAGIDIDALFSLLLGEGDS